MEIQTQSQATANHESEAPDAAEILGGGFLRKEDLDGPITVTIVGSRWERFKGQIKRKIVLSFREIDKPLILNVENTAFLSELYNTTKSQFWRGPITLYNEPNVFYRGERTGGIRFKPVQQLAVAQAPQMEQPPQALQPLAVEPQPTANTYANGSAVQPTPRFRQ